MDSITTIVRNHSTRLKPSELEILFSAAAEEKWARSKLEDYQIEVLDAVSPVDQLRKVLFDEAFYGPGSAQRRSELLDSGFVRCLPNRAMLRVSAYFSDPAVMTAIGLIVTVKVTAYVTRYWDRGIDHLAGNLVPRMEAQLSTASLRRFRMGVRLVQGAYRNWHYLLLGAASLAWAYQQNSTDDVLQDSQRLANAPGKLQWIASDTSGWAVDEVIEWIRDSAVELHKSVLAQIDAEEKLQIDQKRQAWLASCSCKL